jgi:hypothetical protein
LTEYEIQLETARKEIENVLGAGVCFTHKEFSRNGDPRCTVTITSTKFSEDAGIKFVGSGSTPELAALNAKEKIQRRP